MRLALSSISAFMVIATRGQALSTSRGLGLRVFLAKSGAIWFYDKKRREIPSSGLSINMAGETVGVGSPMKNLGLVIDSQFEPHRVGGCQCLVRPAAEHRRGESHGASTIRKRRSVPSDVRGPSMGGRSDSESLQHPASQKAAQGNRYQNRQGIPNGVPRVDDRSDRPPPPVGVSSTGAREKIRPHESIGLGRGLDRTSDPKRPKNRRGGRVGPVAIPADQRGKRTSRRGNGPPKLRDMEKPPRSSAHLQDDPGAHETRRVRRVLRKYGWETTNICHHCGENRDAAQHTLEFYPAWELFRYILCHVVGERSTVSAIVEAMFSYKRS